MNIDLRNKTALVTGSTAGIGRAIALELARAGADVVINGRAPERVNDVVTALTEESAGAGQLSGVAADVGTAAGCDALIAAVPDVDILINNAGIFEGRPVFEIADEEWLNFFEMNVLSGIRLARHYVPRMVDREWGRVIFISSESALQIPTEMVHYGMTKTAQLAVSRGMAECVTGTDVTINSVLPGPTLTEGNDAHLRKLSGSGAGGSIDEIGRAFIAAERPTSIIGRLASPTEVANLVVYVASPQASATTGTALRVDGGVVRSIS
jgi:NAD(P)-dependent dehydrogenase (short-subunit alcohol dehydrogenase family)